MRMKSAFSYFFHKLFITLTSGVKLSPDEWFHLTAISSLASTTIGTATLFKIKNVTATILFHC